MTTIEAKGQNGAVTFDGTYITIIRKGFGSRMMGQVKGEKRILVSTLTAVQLKSVGMMNGYIQFTLPGGNESRSNRTVDAAKDENTVTFTKKQQPQFVELREAVEKAMANSHNPQQATSSSVADELGKLGLLVQQGLLTPEEYQEQKARLLA